MDKVWLLILLVSAIAILAAAAIYFFWRAPVVVGAVAYSSLRVVMAKIWPRLFSWILLSALLFAGLYFVSPQQAMVAYYKFALVIAAGVLGYWFDRAMFPYSRPDGYLKEFWQKGSDEPIGKADFEVVNEYNRVFAAAMIRRAIIVGCTILGVTLGL